MTSAEAHPDWLRSPFAPQEQELRFAARLGLRHGDRFHIRRLLIALIVLGWLPLLLICVGAGTAYGDRVTVPFLRDFLAYGRYLVAAPLLLFTGVVVLRHTSRALAYLYYSGLVDGLEADVQRIVSTAARFWHSAATRWALIVLTVLYVAALWSYAKATGLTSWMFTGERGAEHLSIAGVWNLIVSGALVKYLFVTLTARMLVWLWVLWHLSRLPLRVNPLHPDQACGLRLIGHTQLAFAPLFSALSVQLGCGIATDVHYHGVDLMHFKWIALAFVLSALVLLLGPLLMFARRALLALEEGEMRFGAWANLAGLYTAEERVAPCGNPAEQLSQPEISAFTDASATYASVLETRPVPIDRRMILLTVAAAALPMMLPLLWLLPLATIARELVKVLF